MRTFAYKTARFVTAGHVVTVLCWVWVTVVPLLVTVADFVVVVYTVLVVVPLGAGVTVLHHC